MVTQCYQACFCSLNTVFIVKLNSSSVLDHNFTIKTSFNFQFYSQNKSQSQINSKVKINVFLILISVQNLFLISIIKSIQRLKCISNPDLSSKSIPNLNHKSIQNLKWISDLYLSSESISNLDHKIDSKYNTV